jgi:O-antigen/teichoic acid export membrane protein
VAERRLSRNVLLSVVPWAVPTVLAVIAIPITVRGLGADAYGIIALVGAVAGYLAITQVGLNQAIVRYVSMFVAQRSGRALRECVRIVVLWFAGTGAVGGVLMWALAPWLVTRVLKVPPTLTSQAIDAFRIGGLTFALSSLGVPLSLLPNSFLRYDLVALFQTLFLSTSVAGPAILVLLGYGLVEVMWFGAALSGVIALVYAIVGIRLVRPFPAEGPSFAEHRRPFVGFVLTNGLNQIWCLVQAQTNMMVIGIAGGTSQAAYFQVSNTMADRTNGLLNNMASVLLPTVSQLAAGGEHDRILGLYRRSSRLLFLLNASITGAVIVLAEPLLRYWISPSFAQQGSTALALLILAQLIAATSQTGGNVNLALGKPRVNLVFSVINSIVNLATVYSLTLAYGVTGAAMSVLLAAFVMPTFVHYTNRRVLHVDSWSVFRECYLPTILITAAVGTVAWFVIRPLASNFVVTIALLGVVTAASLLLAAAFGVITPEDRASLRQALRRTKPDAPAPATLPRGDDDVAE